MFKIFNGTFSSVLHWLENDGKFYLVAGSTVLTAMYILCFYLNRILTFETSYELLVLISIVSLVSHGINFAIDIKNKERLTSNVVWNIFMCFWWFFNLLNSSLLLWF